MASGGPKRASRGPPTPGRLPRGLQEAPNSHPRGSQEAPGSLQEAPEKARALTPSPLHAFSNEIVGFETHASLFFGSVPSSALCAGVKKPKKPPKQPKTAPREHPRGPERAKIVPPRRRQDAPRGPPRAPQDGPGRQHLPIPLWFFSYGFLRFRIFRFPPLHDWPWSQPDGGGRGVCQNVQGDAMRTLPLGPLVELPVGRDPSEGCAETGGGTPCELFSMVP